jgi:hypothetical protein
MSERWAELARCIRYPLTRQAIDDYRKIEAESPTDSYTTQRYERRLFDRLYSIRAMFASECTAAISRDECMLMSIEQIEAKIREALQDSRITCIAKE